MLDVLFPKRCALCDNVLRGDEIGLGCCKMCDERVERIRSPRCYACGAPLLSFDKELCDDCIDRPRSYESNRAVYAYGDMVKDSLMRFKYHNRREYAAFYGQVIAEELDDYIKSSGVQALVPIPVHKNRRKKRGYNQAELLANEISRYCGVKVLNKYLIRSQETTAQKGLSNLERLKNLENTFNVTQDMIQLDKVMLVDDIFTTGSTIEACTRVLLRAGVSKVYALTVAVGQGY